MFGSAGNWMSIISQERCSLSFLPKDTLRPELPSCSPLHNLEKSHAGWLHCAWMILLHFLALMIRWACPCDPWPFQLIVRPFGVPIEMNFKLMVFINSPLGLTGCIDWVKQDVLLLNKAFLEGTNELGNILKSLGCHLRLAILANNVRPT